MQLRSLVENLDIESAQYIPYINTGGPCDIVNGKFMPTEQGGLALSGGLGLTTAVIATANKFKSTFTNSNNIGAMARFPASHYFVYDTEYAALDKRRLANMSDIYLDEPVKREAHIADLVDRITLFSPDTVQGASLDAFIDFLKTIRDEKVKHAKDYTVELEIVDPDTGQPYRRLLPTFSSIDSWTEAMVRQMNVKNEEFNADTEMKDQRTINMEEAWQKTRLMRQVQTICAKGGIHLSMTGHLGKKIAIGTTPNSKDMQYMGQDETAKSMGNKFNFLMSSIWKIGNTTALTDKSDRKESEYPSESHIAGTELQRLMLTLVRCKNTASGYNVNLVSSQRFGIMVGLSYYDNLRENKYFGLGSPNKVRNPLLGDMNLGRTKIFDMSSQYQVRRALELTYQLFFVQNNWSMRDQPVNYMMDLETFALKLMTSNSYAIDDILNSRGWWTYKGAAVERDMITLPEALAMIDGSYRPKFLDIPKSKI